MICPTATSGCKAIGSGQKNSLFMRPVNCLVYPSISISSFWPSLFSIQKLPSYRSTSCRYSHYNCKSHFKTSTIPKPLRNKPLSTLSKMSEITHPTIKGKFLPTSLYYVLFFEIGHSILQKDSYTCRRRKIRIVNLAIC